MSPPGMGSTTTTTTCSSSSASRGDSHPPRRRPRSSRTRPPTNTMTRATFMDSILNRPSQQYADPPLSSSKQRTRATSTAHPADLPNAPTAPASLLSGSMFHGTTLVAQPASTKYSTHPAHARPASVAGWSTSSSLFGRSRKHAKHRRQSVVDLFSDTASTTLAHGDGQAPGTATTATWRKTRWWEPGSKFRGGPGIKTGPPSIADSAITEPAMPSYHGTGSSTRNKHRLSMATSTAASTSAHPTLPSAAPKRAAMSDYGGPTSTTRRGSTAGRGAPSPIPPLPDHDPAALRALNAKSKHALGTGVAPLGQSSQSLLALPYAARNGLRASTSSTSLATHANPANDRADIRRRSSSALGHASNSALHSHTRKHKKSGSQDWHDFVAEMNHRDISKHWAAVDASKPEHRRASAAQRVAKELHEEAQAAAEVAQSRAAAQASARLRASGAATPTTSSLAQAAEQIIGQTLPVEPGLGGDEEGFHVRQQGITILPPGIEPGSLIITDSQLSRATSPVPFPPLAASASAPALASGSTARHHQAPISPTSGSTRASGQVPGKEKGKGSIASSDGREEYATASEVSDVEMEAEAEAEAGAGAVPAEAEARVESSEEEESTDEDDDEDDDDDLVIGGAPTLDPLDEVDEDSSSAGHSHTSSSVAPSAQRSSGVFRHHEMRARRPKVGVVGSGGVGGGGGGGYSGLAPGLHLHSTHVHAPSSASAAAGFVPKFVGVLGGAGAGAGVANAGAESGTKRAEKGKARAMDEVDDQPPTPPAVVSMSMAVPPPPATATATATAAAGLAPVVPTTSTMPTTTAITTTATAPATTPTSPPTARESERGALNPNPAEQDTPLLPIVNPLLPSPQANRPVPAPPPPARAPPAPPVPGASSGNAASLASGAGVGVGVPSTMISSSPSMGLAAERAGVEGEGGYESSVPPTPPEKDALPFSSSSTALASAAAGAAGAGVEDDESGEESSEEDEGSSGSEEEDAEEEAEADEESESDDSDDTVEEASAPTATAAAAEAEATKTDAASALIRARQRLLNNNGNGANARAPSWRGRRDDQSSERSRLLRQARGKNSVSFERGADAHGQGEGRGEEEGERASLRSASRLSTTQRPPMVQRRLSDLSLGNSFRMSLILRSSDGASVSASQSQRATSSLRFKLGAGDEDTDDDDDADSNGGGGGAASSDEDEDLKRRAQAEQDRLRSMKVGEDFFGPDLNSLLDRFETMDWDAPGVGAGTGTEMGSSTVDKLGLDGPARPAGASLVGKTADERAALEAQDRLFEVRRAQLERRAAADVDGAEGGGAQEGVEVGSVVPSVAALWLLNPDAVGADVPVSSAASSAAAAAAEPVVVEYSLPGAVVPATASVGSVSTLIPVGTTNKNSPRARPSSLRDADGAADPSTSTSTKKTSILDRSRFHRVKKGASKDAGPEGGPSLALSTGKAAPAPASSIGIGHAKTASIASASSARTDPEESLRAAAALTATASFYGTAPNTVANLATKATASEAKGAAGREKEVAASTSMSTSTEGSASASANGFSTPASTLGSLKMNSLGLPVASASGSGSAALSSSDSAPSALALGSGLGLGKVSSSATASSSTSGPSETKTTTMGASSASAQPQSKSVSTSTSALNSTSASGAGTTSTSKSAPPPLPSALKKTSAQAKPLSLADSLISFPSALPARSSSMEKKRKGKKKVVTTTSGSVAPASSSSAAAAAKMSARRGEEEEEEDGRVSSSDEEVEENEESSAAAARRKAEKSSTSGVVSSMSSPSSPPPPPSAWAARQAKVAKSERKAERKAAQLKAAETSTAAAAEVGKASSTEGKKKSKKKAATSATSGTGAGEVSTFPSAAKGAKTAPPSATTAESSSASAQATPKPALVEAFTQTESDDVPPAVTPPGPGSGSGPANQAEADDDSSSDESFVSVADRLTSPVTTKPSQPIMAVHTASGDVKASASVPKPVVDDHPIEASAKLAPTDVPAPPSVQVADSLLEPLPEHTGASVASSSPSDMPGSLSPPLSDLWSDQSAVSTTITTPGPADSVVSKQRDLSPALHYVADAIESQARAQADEDAAALATRPTGGKLEVGGRSDKMLPLPPAPDFSEASQVPIEDRTPLARPYANLGGVGVNLIPPTPPALDHSGSPLSPSFKQIVPMPEPVPEEEPAETTIDARPAMQRSVSGRSKSPTRASKPVAASVALPAGLVVETVAKSGEKKVRSAKIPGLDATAPMAMAAGPKHPNVPRSLVPLPPEAGLLIPLEPGLQSLSLPPSVSDAVSSTGSDSASNSPAPSQSGRSSVASSALSRSSRTSSALLYQLGMSSAGMRASPNNLSERRPSMAAIDEWESSASPYGAGLQGPLSPYPPLPASALTRSTASLPSGESPMVVRQAPLGAPASHFVRATSPLPAGRRGSESGASPMELGSSPIETASVVGSSYAPSVTQSASSLPMTSTNPSVYRPVKDPSKLSSKIDDALYGRTTMQTVSITSGAFRGKVGTSRKAASSVGHGHAGTARDDASIRSSGEVPPHLREEIAQTTMALTAHTPPPRKVGSAQVLVQVIAVAIDEMDRLIVQDRIRHGKGFGFVPGRSFCGRIMECGWNVKSFRKGDVVFGMQDASKCGALAEFMIIDVAHVCKAPEDCLTTEQISALPAAGLLSYEVVATYCNQLERGARVLILNAHDGIGLLVMQQSVDLGLIIVAQCPASVADGVAVCMANGAHEVVVGEPLWAINSLHESSFDLVVDTVGGRRIYDASRRIIATNGQFATCFGDEHGPASPNLKSHMRSLRRAFFKKDKKNIGYEWVGNLTVEDYKEALESVKKAAEKGDICPRLSSILPFEDAVRAFDPVLRGVEQEPGAVVVRIS